MTSIAICIHDKNQLLCRKCWKLLTPPTKLRGSPMVKSSTDTQTDDSVSHSNTVHCVVCNKPIKRGKPGTCMHETGLDHHLACPLPPETEDAINALIREARVEAIASYKRANEFHEREIRIDELKNARFNTAHDDNVFGYIVNRIKELKGADNE